MRTPGCRDGMREGLGRERAARSKKRGGLGDPARREARSAEAGAAPHRRVEEGGGGVGVQATEALAQVGRVVGRLAVGPEEIAERGDEAGGAQQEGLGIAALVEQAQAVKRNAAGERFHGVGVLRVAERTHHPGVE